MIETIRNAWKIPELRKKILFTVFALLIFRLGSVVPVPFIDSNMLGATLNLSLIHIWHHHRGAQRQQDRHQRHR